MLVDTALEEAQILTSSDKDYFGVHGGPGLSTYPCILLPLARTVCHVSVPDRQYKPSFVFPEQHPRSQMSQVL